MEILIIAGVLLFFSIKLLGVAAIWFILGCYYTIKIIMWAFTPNNKTKALKRR